MTEAELPVVSVTRSPGAVAQLVDGDTVLFVPDTGKMLLLDALATRVWDLLATPTTLVALCDALAAEFGVTAAQVAADLTEPYALLVESGAVDARVTGEPPA